MTQQQPGLPVVLVVEDEPLIRMEALDMLEHAGFRVLGAASADAAIKIMENNDDIRILFTDIDMPGSMDGIKLANYVRDRWPPVAIVVASGIVDIDMQALPHGSSFFAKPYLSGQIVTALQEIARTI